jgi:predicted ester cyclase
MTEVEVPMGNAMLEQSKQVVRGFFDMVNRRQVERLRQFMADDVVDHNKIIFGEADEPGAAFEGIRQQLAAFDPFEVRAEELVAEGDRVAARVVMSGEHTGTHPRMPTPTNQRFEIEAIFLFTLSGGNISEIRAVSDRLGMFMQLGWDWPKSD